MALKQTTLWKQLRPNLMFLSIIGICPFHISAFRCHFYLPMFCYQIILFALILSFTTVTWCFELFNLINSDLLIYFKSNIAIYADYILSTISYAAHVLSIALIFIERRDHLKLICRLLRADESLRSFINKNTTEMDLSMDILLIVVVLGQLIVMFGGVFYFSSSLEIWLYILYNTVKTIIGYTISIYIQHLAGLMWNRLILLENQLNHELNRATCNGDGRTKQRLNQMFRLFNELTDLHPQFSNVFGNQLLVNIGLQFITVSAGLFLVIVNLYKQKDGLNLMDFCTIFWVGIAIGVNCILVCYAINGTSVQVLNLENKLCYILQRFLVVFEIGKKFVHI